MRISDWSSDVCSSDLVRIFGFNKLEKNLLNPNKARVNIRIQSGTDWFNADIDVRFGNKKASLKPLQKAVRNRHKYVPLDAGTLGILPEEWLTKFEDYIGRASGRARVSTYA